MAKELKDMSVPELCDVLRDHDDWDGGVSDKLRAKQNECESEIIRRIDEAKNTADQLRACLAGDDLEDVPVLAKGLLRAKMSEMSEDHYAASWLDGTGKVLWGMLRGEHREWGMQTVSDETLQLLCTLASESGGWWQDDETFVRLDEWQATHGEMTHVPLVSRINEAKARGKQAGGGGVGGTGSGRCDEEYHQRKPRQTARGHEPGPHAGQGN